MQAVGGELRRAEGCMRTPLTPTLPNRTLTLELFDQGDDFLISLHLAKLGQQKLDQECTIAFSLRDNPLRHGILAHWRVGGGRQCGCAVRVGGIAARIHAPRR